MECARRKEALGGISEGIERVNSFSTADRMTTDPRTAFCHWKGDAGAESAACRNDDSPERDRACGCLIHLCAAFCASLDSATYQAPFPAGGGGCAPNVMTPRGKQQIGVLPLYYMIRMRTGFFRGLIKIFFKLGSAGTVRRKNGGSRIERRCLKQPERGLRHRLCFVGMVQWPFRAMTMPCITASRPLANAACPSGEKCTPSYVRSIFHAPASAKWIPALSATDR